MNSIKTKTDNYTLVGNVCLGGIKIIPTKNDTLSVYVAWENEKAIANKFFSFSYKEVEVTKFDFAQLVEHVTAFGDDVGNSTIPERYFPELF